MTKLSIITLLLLFINNLDAKQCSVEANPRFRIFNDLVAYKNNTNAFDPTTSTYVGNFVRILHSKSTLQAGDLAAFDSDEIWRLDLNNTQIRNIENGTFRQLYCLEILNLQENMILSIDGRVFDDVEHLRYLNLSHNKIVTLQADIFKNNYRLRSLDLSFNQFSQLNIEFETLSQLLYLNVSHNDISHLNMPAFNALHNIRSLDFSYNSLSEFYIKTHFEFLATLKLSGNSMHTLNMHDIIQFLPNLSLIQLEENPWMCSELEFIVKALSESHVIYSAKNHIASNVHGIDCIDATTTTTTTKVITDSTTKSSPIASTTVPATQYVADQNLLQAISDLKQLMVGFIVLMLLVFVLDISVRLNVRQRLLNLFNNRGNAHEIENIRLLPSNVSRV